MSRHDYVTTRAMGKLLVWQNGQPTAMVAWKSTLSDVEIAAVITYTRNSWSNHTGEAIQPAEVKADRS